jgi:hypothetical protein
MIVKDYIAGIVVLGLIAALIVFPVIYDLSSEVNISDYHYVRVYVKEYPELEPVVRDTLSDGKITNYEMIYIIQPKISDIQKQSTINEIVFPQFHFERTD